ncbi:MAG: hypothetical protein CMJ80_02765 [Planctomycetaceae bacterium]|nr:hypothetical protein [Planctomycetaceae bacterium]
MKADKRSFFINRQKMSCFFNCEETHFSVFPQTRCGRTGHRRISKLELIKISPRKPESLPARFQAIAVARRHFIFKSGDVGCRILHSIFRKFSVFKILIRTKQLSFVHKNGLGNLHLATA